jgi:ribosomal protein S27E
MWNIIAGILKIFQDVRTCPKCGNRQVESSETRTQTVRCKNCGADIHPPKEDFYKQLAPSG